MTTQPPLVSLKQPGMLKLFLRFIDLVVTESAEGQIMLEEEVIPKQLDQDATMRVAPEGASNHRFWWDRTSRL